MQLLRPEVALNSLLLGLLAKNLDCLFAVAYVQEAGLELLADEIRRRMRKTRFRLRLVFQSEGLVSEPVALETLREIGRQAQGILELRYAPRGFHAKAYGFRRGARSAPAVLIGSANLTGKAMGINSGELGVQLAESARAREAWSVLEAFWQMGTPVTPRWLAAYREAYERARNARAPANRIEAQWNNRIKPPARQRPTIGGEPLFLMHMEPLSAQETASVDRAARNAGTEIAPPYLRYSTRGSAMTPPRGRNILCITWFQTPSLRIHDVCLLRVDREPFALTDPRDDTRMWIVPYRIVRGSSLVIRKRDAQATAQKLRRFGFTYRKLGGMSGYLRGRRTPLIRALRTLGWRF